MTRTALGGIYAENVLGACILRMALGGIYDKNSSQRHLYPEIVLGGIYVENAS